MYLRIHLCKHSSAAFLIPFLLQNPILFHIFQISLPVFASVVRILFLPALLAVLLAAVTFRIILHLRMCQQEAVPVEMTAGVFLLNRKKKKKKEEFLPDSTAGYGFAYLHIQSDSLEITIEGHDGGYPGSTTWMVYWIEGDTYISFNFNGFLRSLSGPLQTVMQWL